VLLHDLLPSELFRAWFTLVGFDLDRQEHRERLPYVFRGDGYRAPANKVSGARAQPKRMPAGVLVLHSANVISE
jgi:hypothetical protein